MPGHLAVPIQKLRASLASAAASGVRCGAWWGKYDRDSSSWKTAQYSLLGGLDSFSETWPNWGLMHDGAFYPLPTPALLISGDESGYLPTPNCSMDRSPCPQEAIAAVQGRSREDGSKITLRIQDYVAAFGRIPTPTKSMKKGATIVPRKNGRKREMDRLDYWVMENFGGRSSSLSPLFAEWVMAWPIGWTDSQPLETDKFQQWLSSHGKHC